MNYLLLQQLVTAYQVIPTDSCLKELRYSWASCTVNPENIRNVANPFGFFSFMPDLFMFIAHHHIENDNVSTNWTCNSLMECLTWLQRTFVVFFCIDNLLIKRLKNDIQLELFYNNSFKPWIAGFQIDIWISKTRTWWLVG